MRNISLISGVSNTRSVEERIPIIIATIYCESHHNINYLYVVYVFLTDIYALYVIKKVIWE
jgi:hypothetical protein